MLRVVVESAKNLPKKKVGSPDPITSVIFKGECRQISTCGTLFGAVEKLELLHSYDDFSKNVTPLCRV